MNAVKSVFVALFLLFKIRKQPRTTSNLFNQFLIIDTSKSVKEELNITNIYKNDSLPDNIQLLKTNNHNSKYERKIPPETNCHISVTKARSLIIRQLEIENKRERTIIDYLRWFDSFFDFADVETIDQITASDIYDWLALMQVAETTKNIRLKALKAVLSRFYDRGYMPVKFWGTIRIKIDEPTKKASKDDDIQVLLDSLDLTSFFDLRDAVAVMLIYKTGIRNSTMAQLREEHIDFNRLVLNLPAEIMKNRRKLTLPIDRQTSQLIQSLIKTSNQIRKNYKKVNDFIFINRLGDTINQKSNSNVIQKRLHTISNELGIKNINPHSLRRAYATNLLNKDVSVATISRALGHSSLSVTHKYLDIEENALVEELRDL
ncbi:tyrosine-type recombinase/integrase [Carnobacterium sp. FSL W8-0810]|uniref:tyrosine-type recombinase/integrase n=1 Tax=Carnobacterium sp. FSL W8-0810 TaxID=2954705 RepID=UPI0030F54639